ncbi:hypothetical protein JQ615_35585 [Bradyrhizobium jicamae]|uniref:Uncharacterized protein n=1 Tax=Bradyrhizobium jicamae TaxID=280332 RepID=A0ABS5FV91_9BRAD|nr:hypothetical protein [Bradyrhizobium jicamae]MBR0800697.1 hypothetical protein [Bradyrhizobium jicamae]
MITLKPAEPLGAEQTMDWPVLAAVTAVAVIGGAVVFEAATLLGSGTMSAKPQQPSYEPSAERSAYDIPGFAGSGNDERPLSFPLIRLIDPDRVAEPEHPTSSTKDLASGPAAPEQTKKITALPAHSNASPGNNEIKVAKLTPTGIDPAPGPTQAVAPALVRPEQWRAIPTANASYFNLGGHINSAGIVDSLASGHLRDALKQHSKFGQLPSDIRNHILTQNIDLCRIAPYRTLLGMDDKVLEQEQAVKFIRVR